MKIELTETINIVPWSEGVNNAPAELVTKAKQMVEEGRPAVFGRVEGNEGTWVVVGSSTTNHLYVTYRANS